MKVAIVSCIPLFPTHGGNRLRILSLADALARMGAEVHFVLLPSRQLGDYEESEHVDRFGAACFHAFERPLIANARYYMRRAVGDVRSRVGTTLLGPRWGRRNVDYIYFRGFDEQMRALHAQLRFDIVITNYVQFSKILTVLPDDVLKIIDTHDSFSHIRPAGAVMGLNRANIVLAIQDDEARHFRSQLGAAAQKKVVTLSHIVEKFERTRCVETAGASFIGSAFRANRLSLDHCITNILPRILEVRPEFRLFVAGTISAEIADHPNIVKLGLVRDIASVFALAPISINPITAGTGVKIKLLESMARGVPVVTTRFGVAGIEEAYLGGVSIAEDGDDAGFAARVLELYDDGAYRASMADKAYGSAMRWRDAQLSTLAQVLKQAPKPAPAAAMLSAK